MRLNPKEVRAGMELCVTLRSENNRKYALVVSDGTFSRHKIAHWEEPTLTSCASYDSNSSLYRYQRDANGTYIAALVAYNEKADYYDPMFISRQTGIHGPWSDERKRLDEEKERFRLNQLREEAEKAAYLDAIAIILSKLVPNETYQDIERFCRAITGDASLETRLGLDTMIHNRSLMLHRKQVIRLAGLLANVDADASTAIERATATLLAANQDLARRAEAAESRLNAVRFMLQTTS